MRSYREHVLRLTTHPARRMEALAALLIFASFLFPLAARSQDSGIEGLRITRVRVVDNRGAEVPKRSQNSPWQLAGGLISMLSAKASARSTRWGTSRTFGPRSREMVKRFK